MQHEATHSAGRISIIPQNGLSFSSAHLVLRSQLSKTKDPCLPGPNLLLQSQNSFNFSCIHTIPYHPHTSKFRPRRCPGRAAKSTRENFGHIQTSQAVQVYDCNPHPVARCRRMISYENVLCITIIIYIFINYYY